MATFNFNAKLNTELAR